MAPLRHLFPPDTASAEAYLYPHKVRGGEFKVPPRDDRVAHGTMLAGQVQVAEQTAHEGAEALPDVKKPKGVVLEFSSEPKFKLRLQSLERRQSGIELCNARIDDDDVMHATVFIPEGKVSIFVRLFEAYAKEEDKRSGQPKNKTLAESISNVRLAALESFWTDAGAFPQSREDSQWWELWLREKTNPHDVGDQFRAAAQAAGVQVSQREIRFPERRVLLARATSGQLAQIENLFDLLAELKLAKRLATEFVTLEPREQAELVDAVLARIQPPPANAPAVCHFDTGANRGHPLLAPAMGEEDVTSVDPDWSPADLRGHGTEMAGLGLYGCLTGILGNDEPVTLRHRLESVKILPDDGTNEPDLYGEITNQAALRIEIIAPQRNRVFCLTVTADSRDEGYPSSWSAALDALCSGVNDEDNRRRLVIASAGNLPLDERHDYPNSNHVAGVEDPAQAWNVLTVGACTDKAVIQTEDYADWNPIAQPGRLSPASRTSTVWSSKSWPFKPDIVMEGGNNAIDPATSHADFVDDLSLLTTRMAATGALLTTTGDTSAAAALAARYAAMIQAGYPELWPESVRGLLIHSARWTSAMLEEFPHNQRHARLRCYGFGVPELELALWSASNATTLIVQDELQPYHKVEGVSEPKTKDMHLHRLPWPKAVLRDLGELDISMRVTLSYFIEPSPGMRGRTRKHLYQSHGLRFDVRLPEETDNDFHRRLSKAAWEDDEDEIDAVGDNRIWAIGPRLRPKGSVHSDVWSGTAAQLADCNTLAVFPVSGWWRFRHHLGRWRSKARYSLIVTLETESTDVDLYTPIANEIAQVIET
jgi:hypothetical protein